MNSIDKLKEELRGKTAEEAIDALARTGALDHSLARRCLIVKEYEQRLGSTGDIPQTIKEDLAEVYSCDVRTIGRAIARSH